MYDIHNPEFQNSPLATSFYNVMNELREVDPARKKRAWHTSVALWAAWESHRMPQSMEIEGMPQSTNLLDAVGLPKTQKGLAELLGVSSRTLRNYRDKYGHLVIISRHSGIEALMSQYDYSVIAACGVSASQPFGKNSATDRKTFGSWRGWGKERVDLDVKSGGEALPPPIQIYLPDNGRDDAD